MSATLVAFAFRGLDLRAAARATTTIGPLLPALLLPSFAALTIETLGWRAVFAGLGHAISFRALLRVRLSTEAVGVSVPLGVLVAEALKVPLLARHCRVPGPVGLAGVAARKYLVMSAQSAYLALGFLGGGDAIAAGFASVGAPACLCVITLGLALGVFVAAQLVAITLGAGDAVQRAVGVLGALRSTRARALARRIRAASLGVDDAAAAFFGTNARRRALLAAPFLVAWLCEATETWIVLRALGARVGFGDALGVEVLVGFARQALVFLPGGLGAQEFGYSTFLLACGVRPELAAAFLLVKRLRDLARVTVGHSLLVDAGARAPALAPTEGDGPAPGDCALDPVP